MSLSTRNKYQNGLTLVELMIAMVISLVLVGGVTQTYISTKQTYRLTEAQSRIQENGRFALYLLTRDIRMADFWGCLTTPPKSADNHLAVTTGIYDFTDGLAATNDAGLNDSDTITLKGVSNNGVHLTQVVSNATDVQTVSDNSGLGVGVVVLLSNCLQGEIFQIDSTGSTGAVTLDNTYGLDASIYKPEARIYSIGPGASGEPALLLNGVELVEGVENMQILYGEDTDGDLTPNYYVDAATVTDMEQVVSVKVSLLLRSMENNVTSSNLVVTYNNGTSIIANRRLGRVFSATINIRNRMQ
ncbi:MAG: hypothetical protein DRR42_19745 [Gammaproteobacteria bacterium]|nr:MAG: hypothetical protein DRR42_19745 [Gammaproteobacteria bacterium]